MIESAFDTLLSQLDSLYLEQDVKTVKASCNKNPKLERLKQERQEQIDKDNNRLVKNIMGIKSTPSLQKLNVQKIPSQSQNTRSKEAKRIYQENLRLLKKLESASKKSNYGKHKMLTDFSKSRQLLSRISNFNGPPPTSSTVSLVRMKTKPLYPSWEQIKKESQDLLDHPLLLLESSL